ncbi:hypothetical protein IF1G_05281 [Cordyceps javanica]|uniref:Uncharacterized protein n=1 Tax=Cordyceps javanica TaxID=43265 RepID=A0A545V4Q6_9HYPO|nr:hypothetical protein IF1G_05281 [Cordyceps javanica]
MLTSSCAETSSLACIKSLLARGLRLVDCRLRKLDKETCSKRRTTFVPTISEAVNSLTHSRMNDFQRMFILHEKSEMCASIVYYTMTSTAQR